MENKAYLSGMLELIPQPAFAVENGIITEANQHARMLFIVPGEPVAPLLGQNAKDYEIFQEGHLCLAMTLCNQTFDTSVRQVDGQNIFVLTPQSDQTDLQLLQLAAGHLRQPLADLNVFANLLDPKSDTSRKIKHRLFQLQRMALNMSDTIRYLNNRFVKPVFVDVCAQISEWVEQAEPLVSACGMKLEFSCPREPFCSVIDEEKLERALYNMLSNAIKASSQGDIIQVTVSHDGKRLTLSVRDHGVGIPSQKLGVSFSSYRRTPGEELHGIGLGMTLIRNAAITHEGVLLVVPQETGGTLVSICITMQSPKNDRVQSPIIRCDYAGEQDHGLLELSDLLPNELYE